LWYSHEYLKKFHFITVQLTVKYKLFEEKKQFFSNFLSFFSFFMLTFSKN
jgi:hypothetical protein